MFAPMMIYNVDKSPLNGSAVLSSKDWTNRRAESINRSILLSDALQAGTQQNLNQYPNWTINRGTKKRAAVYPYGI